ncbi:hypothetical protein V6R21_05720 [Limibacter armeniacum]
MKALLTSLLLLFLLPLAAICQDGVNRSLHRPCRLFIQNNSTEMDMTLLIRLTEPRQIVFYYNGKELRRTKARTGDCYMRLEQQPILGIQTAVCPTEYRIYLTSELEEGQWFIDAEQERCKECDFAPDEEKGPQEWRGV